MIPQLGMTNGFGIEVPTTQGRGFSPEGGSERLGAKIISVSEEAHPAIQAQAHAFKKRIVKLVEFYLREAIKSDRTTVYNAITDAGHPELAELIRRL